MKTNRVVAVLLGMLGSTAAVAVEPASSALRQLQAQVPFVSWEGHVIPAAIAESRLIYKTTVSKIIDIGTGKPKQTYLPVLNGYIEGFNRVDEKYEFIETDEREEICERLAEILAVLSLPGVRNCDDLTAARDW